MVVNDTKLGSGHFGNVWDRNFVTYIAMQIIDIYELHRLAVHLGLNINQYAGSDL